MPAILNGNELTLTGDVGDFGFGDYFTLSDVVIALAQVADDAELTVYLNSGGGYASEGAAIYAVLSRRTGSTTIVVEGAAASAASLIAMAGDTTIMSVGAIMMIHDPSVFTFGTADDHLKTVEGLNALAVAYARVYATKSGKTEAEARAIMKAERWFAPEEAVAEGFADEVGDGKAKAVAAFDYRIYAHAPQRLVALAKKKNWLREDAKEPAVASAAQRSQPKGTSMTDKERADQLAAELADMKAKLETATAANDKNAVATMTAELEKLRQEKAERENADAIMALDEAKGREKQAKALAEAGLPADKAKAVLAVAAKDAAEDTTDADGDADSYERRRLNGAGLSGGGAAPRAKAKISASDIYASRRAN